MWSIQRYESRRRACLSVLGYPALLCVGRSICQPKELDSAGTSEGMGRSVQLLLLCLPTSTSAETTEIAPTTRTLLMQSKPPFAHGLSSFRVALTYNFAKCCSVLAHTDQGCLDDASIVVPRGGREASPHLLTDNDDLVRAFAKVCMYVWRATGNKSDNNGRTRCRLNLLC